MTVGPNDADHDATTAAGVSFESPSSDEDAGGLVVIYADDHASLRPVFALSSRDVVIGRSPPADIVLPYAAVSRMHARIIRTDDGYLLRDLDSRNGVVVDGVRVKEALLARNEVVRIGDVLFKFVPHGAAAYAPYRIDGTLEQGARTVTIAGAVGGSQMARLSVEVTTAARAEIPVLVTGESGTGKELVASAIHAASGRSGPFVAINCAAIPHDLVESELFGFKKGAFSGAHREHPGLFRAASGGTLLLDEIGDMPLPAQAKLLRALETREVHPLGGLQAERVDVRIVAATHRDLAEHVEAGTFRGDLHARLNGYGIALPPLRDRKEDLYMLVRHLAHESGASGRDVTFRFMLAACNYAWPYNVRELASAVRRVVSVSDGGPLDAKHLPDVVTASMVDYGMAREAGVGPPRQTGRPSASELEALLRTHGGNLAAVGRVLGKDRAQIHRWLQQLALDPNTFR